MHPPTFSAYAREADAQTTTSMAFVLPYRSSLLFNLDLKVAMDLTNTARFDADDIPNLISHGLMMPNHFDKLDWQVCAPLPRPKGAKLGQLVDVRKEIVKLIAGMGLSTDASALQADHPPYVDACAPLQPRAGADQDAPTAIDAGADDQPYPFYGRAGVAWGK